ncbi:MAG: hypothetical protein U0N62_02625, partial [Hydrogeniiclostridium sp.]
LYRKGSLLCARAAAAEKMVVCEYSHCFSFAVLLPTLMHGNQVSPVSRAGKGRRFSVFRGR